MSAEAVWIVGLLVGMALGIPCGLVLSWVFDRAEDGRRP
jgi:hypothetical protein